MLNESIIAESLIDEPISPAMSAYDKVFLIPQVGGFGGRPYHIRVGW